MHLVPYSPQVSRRSGSHRAGTSGLEGAEPSTRQLGRRDARAEVCAADGTSPALACARHATPEFPAACPAPPCPLPPQRKAAQAEEQAELDRLKAVAQPQRWQLPPHHVQAAGMNLTFYGFYKEGVPESAQEQWRVRHVRLIYYLEDDSMLVFEQPGENTGLPQGRLLGRHRVPKPRATHGRAAHSGEAMGTATTASLCSGRASASVGGRPQAGGSGQEYYTWRDLRVGESVLLYGRNIALVDCDGATRKWYREQGVVQPPALPAPEDVYSVARAEFQARETGTAPAEGENWRGKTMSPVKRFMEAQRGNASKRLTSGVPDTLAKFLAHDGHVLRFKALWDDRAAVYGTVHHLVLQYYLADDTVEVLRVVKPNDGMGHVRTFFKRAPLPLPGKQLPSDARARDIEDDFGDEDYYTWRHPDMRVGGSVQVMGREVQLYDAEPATYAWYNAELGEDMRPAANADMAKTGAVARPTTPEVQPAPYDEFRFGSEEDSLGSFFSLVPKIPRKDQLKMEENADRILRFHARLEPAPGRALSQVDAKRVFVMKYHLATDQVSIFEPPQRNSGVLGGKFLGQTKMRNPDTGDFFRPQDFALGAVVNINGHRFKILEPDARTVRLLGGKTRFETAEPVSTLCRIAAELAALGMTAEQAFAALDADYSGFVEEEELEEALQTWGIRVSQPDLTALFRWLAAEGGARTHGAVPGSAADAGMLLLEHLQQAYASLPEDLLRTTGAPIVATGSAGGQPRGATPARAVAQASTPAITAGVGAAGTGKLPEQEDSSVARYGAKLAAAPNLSASQRRLLGVVLSNAARQFGTAGGERDMRETLHKLAGPAAALGGTFTRMPTSARVARVGATTLNFMYGSSSGPLPSTQTTADLGGKASTLVDGAMDGTQATETLQAARARAVLTRPAWRSAVAMSLHVGPREMAVLEARFFPPGDDTIPVEPFMELFQRAMRRHAAPTECV